ncbi:MAG TPA: ATP-binding protein [Acidobacteriota bacterium]
MSASSYPPAENHGARAARRPFILLRLTLIIATSYLVLAQISFARFPPLVGWLIAIGLLSNLVLARVPDRWARSSTFVGSIIIADTLWITAVLIYSGNFGPEFFYLYFFVLFLSAVGESLGMIVLGAVVISSAYLYGVLASGSIASLWNASNLVRIPFLLAVASFYGYLVDRLRKERQRALLEAQSVARLQETRAVLEQANRELEREIAERRRAEQELHKLSRAVEQSPSIVIITDTRGTIEYVNPQFTHRTGYGADQTLGRNLLEHPYMTQGADVTEAQAALLQCKAWSGELQQQRRDGESFWASTSISPLTDSDGRCTHTIVVQVDISEQKNAEQMLRQANEELTKLNQMKSDFVATVSHELRTPLTSIKNSLDLLDSGRAGALQETQARFVAMASRNAKRLALIIQDILDLSKIEAGKLSFQFGPLQPRALLEELHALFEPQAASGSLSLELDCPALLPTVWADSDRSIQVLSNLLNNAIKFTPAGGRIVLAARAAAEAVEFSVRDTGVGIAERDRERVFEPFYQSGDSLTDKSRGTGLGLSISRNLVEVQGGSLELESALGRGSRFFFRLPVHSEKTVELAAFETEIQQHRIYPHFGVLVFELAAATPAAIQSDPRLACRALERIQQQLQSALPRATDLLSLQASFRRLILVLLGTRYDGSLVVRRKLEPLLAQTEITVDGIRVPEPRILGPACFPQDGRTGREIIASLYRPAPAPAAQHPTAAAPPRRPGEKEEGWQNQPGY